MAIKRKIECEVKRSRLTLKYKSKREQLKNEINHVRIIHYTLQFIFICTGFVCKNGSCKLIEILKREFRNLCRCQIFLSQKQERKIQEIRNLQIKLHELPRNSSATRRKNRCWATGRSRGFYRDFGLSRHVLREMGFKGLIPGLKKSSW